MRPADSDLRPPDIRISRLTSESATAHRSSAAAAAAASHPQRRPSSSASDAASAHHRLRMDIAQVASTVGRRHRASRGRPAGRAGFSTAARPQRRCRRRDRCARHSALVGRRLRMAPADRSSEPRHPTGAPSPASRRLATEVGGCQRRSMSGSTCASRRTRAAPQFDGVAHWDRRRSRLRPPTVAGRVDRGHARVTSLRCLDPETAPAWCGSRRSAVERLSVDALRQACGGDLALAAECARTVSTVCRIRGWRRSSSSGCSRGGFRLRQQIVLAGRPCGRAHRRAARRADRRLRVSFDVGADATDDVAHDAELRLRGFTVLRFTYAQVVHDWPAVERAIARAVAAGAHLAA